MKSRKIDWYDRDDVNKVKALAEFMFNLIPRDPMEELLGQAEEIADEFCSDCEQHKENCSCHSSYDDYDYDYDYDRWKDQQLEEKADAESNKD